MGQSVDLFRPIFISAALQVSIELLRLAFPDRRDKTNRLDGRDIPAPPLACPRPMHATRCVVWPCDDGWSYEIDFEGRRVLVVKDGAHVQLHGLQPGAETRHLIAAVASARRDRFILDGVFAAGPSVMRPASPHLRSYPFIYVAFDLLHLDGDSLIEQPLKDRRAALARLPIAAPVAKTCSFPAPLPDAWVKRIGGKGSIAKHADSRYEPGVRSDSWRKLRKPGIGDTTRTESAQKFLDPRPRVPYPIGKESARETTPRSGRKIDAVA